jgi:hypothetical protein
MAFSAEQVYFLEPVQQLSGSSHVTATTGKRKVTGGTYIHVKQKINK